MNRTITSAIEIARIEIIQSLPEKDTQTGTKLLQHLNDMEYTLDIPPPTLRDIEDEHELYAELDDISNSAVPGAGILLHLEIHGSENNDGLVLANGKLVSWESISQKLVEVNRRSHFQLLLFLAVCSGFYFWTALSPLRPAPIWGIVAPPKPISTGSILDAIPNYYQTWIQSGNGNEAVTALNANTVNDDAFVYSTSERMFSLAVRRYFDDYTNPTEVRKRSKRIQKRLKKQGVYRSMGQIGKDLTNREQTFMMAKQKFFMFDDLPEMKNRVSIRYSDILDRNST